MNPLAPGEITLLLEQMQLGDDAARAKLITLVYPQLKRLAAGRLRGERTDHTLQPTALVHEAFVRLSGTSNIEWRNRAQFFGLVAEIMRNVLVDAARRRRTSKRGSGARALDLDDLDNLDVSIHEHPDVILDVDRLLLRLHALDRRQAQVVELRYFAGLTEPETARTLGVSERTVKRDWNMARAWMRRELSGR
jgi:RNA polymerase sigma-70 factor (ECF subfamily)